MTYELSKKLVDVSKIYQKGKTHIPAEIRRRLFIKDGDKIAWYAHDNGSIIIEKV